jgi:hypothetical protein
VLSMLGDVMLLYMYCCDVAICLYMYCCDVAGIYFEPLIDNTSVGVLFYTNGLLGF